MHVGQIVHLLAGGGVEFTVYPVELVVDLRVLLLRLDGCGDVAPVGAGLGEADRARREQRVAEPGVDWSNIAATVEPKEENTEIYDELYRMYRELYPATREQMHNLADMQKGLPAES